MNSPDQGPDSIARILQQRAEALARRAGSDGPAGPVLEVVEFKLGPERYAIESSFVREIIPLDDVTPLPCTPPFVRGLINLRGRILPVIDLKRFLGLPEAGIADLHRILVMDSPHMEFGLLADIVGGIRRIPLEDLQPPPPALGPQTRCLRGVTAEMLVVLDGAQLVSHPRLVVHEEVES